MRSVSFLRSAVLPKDYPRPQGPEIAFCGRSNAGKSTLINCIAGGTKVAKVSGTPGKTRLINFFAVGDNYRIVDLPGYGYAARSPDEKKLWAKMIEDYFVHRAAFKGLLIICDIRRKWQEEEEMLKAWAEENGRHWQVVLTKSDKLSNNQIAKSLSQWVKSSGETKERFHAISAAQNKGVKELEQFIFQKWVKGN